MHWWQAVVLGVVEGITEYLPISSTGHLIIAAALLGLDEPSVKGAVDAFNIVIQGGAILAVLGLYRGRVAQMIRGVMGKDPAGLRLLVNLAVAFVPAALLGVLLDDWIEGVLFFPGPVAAALLIGGVYMLGLEQWREGRFSTPRPRSAEREVEDLTPRGALVIGLMQCVAMWPGMSRSMMTITGGVIVRLRPAAAAEFSFLLGLPTLGGACVYKLAKNAMRAGTVGADGEVQRGMFELLGGTAVALGLVTATISAMVAVRWLVAFLNRHGVSPLGWSGFAGGVLLLRRGLGGGVWGVG